MENNRIPSKFSVSILATDDEIWDKVLDTLTLKERVLVDKFNSEIIEPYLGAKEIVIRTKDNSNIAIATLSEIHGGETKWAVYKEAWIYNVSLNLV